MSETTVCPACDSTDLRVQSNDDFRGSQTTADYYCKNCESEFDEPARRDRKQGKEYTLSGLPKKLNEMGRQR